MPEWLGNTILCVECGLPLLHPNHEEDVESSHPYNPGDIDIVSPTDREN